MEHMDTEAESFVRSQMQGSLSRRTLVKRAAVVGLAVPSVSAFIAACGSDSTASPTTAGGGGSDTTAAGGSTETTAGGTETTAAAGKTGGVIKLGTAKPAGPLDPIAMADLGSYNLVVQSFEYLTGPDGTDIGPMLATEWTANADSTEWTFKLREGVKWQDGSDFTADDVVATFERIVAVGDSLGGSIAAGAATASDPSTVVVKMTGPNASFPYLVSMFNPQSAITPKDYAAGTTLDGTPNGTGPFKLTKYDPNTGATFERNDAWWGGKTPLDGIEMLFFTDQASQNTAQASGATDAIQSFAVVGGDSLLNDPNLNVVEAQAATHREVWMGLDEGEFTDKAVRQALALSINRKELIETLFSGKAAIGNDHVIFDIYPFFNADAVKQREQDIEGAKKLLADANIATPVKATLNAVDLGEVPQYAELIQSMSKDAGFDLTLNVESTDTFYGTQWCVTYPCAGSASLGIVDYGHRPVPDVYLLKAFKSGGDWNSSQYASPDLDAAILEYQSSAELEARKTACGKIETIMNEDVPAIIGYRYNGLAAFSKKFVGVEFTALGHTLFAKAAQA
jgi:peptide/nickel transport system substrate-binding protein